MVDSVFSVLGPERLTVLPAGINSSNSPTSTTADVMAQWSFDEQINMTGREMGTEVTNGQTTERDGRGLYWEATECKGREISFYYFLLILLDWSICRFRSGTEVFAAHVSGLVVRTVRTLLEVLSCHVGDLIKG